MGKKLASYRGIDDSSAEQREGVSSAARRPDLVWAPVTHTPSFVDSSLILCITRHLPSTPQPSVNALHQSLRSSCSGACRGVWRGLVGLVSPSAIGAQEAGAVTTGTLMVAAYVKYDFPGARS